MFEYLKTPFGIVGANALKVELKFLYSEKNLSFTIMKFDGTTCTVTK